MSDADFISKTKKHKRSGKILNKISFDEEVVPKNVAEQLTYSQAQENSQEVLRIKPQPRKRQQKKVIPERTTSTKEPKKPKREKKPTQPSKINEINTETEHEEKSEQVEELPDGETTLDPTNPTVKQEESKRAQKRKKYQQLLLDKKVKVDLAMQEKCLNHLSQWKHNRSNWKFEKLRQVWLQQNMFDSDKIPDQFWETLVEYFSNAKGKIRKTIIDDALKIIETTEHDDKSEETEENENEEDDHTSNSNNNKVQRARTMIQCLQE